MELMEEIASKLVPDNILTNYMARIVDSYNEFYLVRKRFTTQLACLSFMTYSMAMGHRTPQKMNISCQSGNIWSSSLVPSKSCYLIYYSFINFFFF
jgi:transformation/transcription domain-associated protein